MKKMFGISVQATGAGLGAMVFSGNWGSILIGAVAGWAVSLCFLVAYAVIKTLRNHKA